MTIRALQYRNLLRDELQAVQDLMLDECASIPSPIQRPIEMLIDGGGKRLRPALVLLYARMCDVDLQKAITAAAGVEMLHTATLVHDDLIDDASMRRGVQTLNTQWSSTATILAGDTMFAMAAKLIARTTDSTLALRFAETLESICAGELRQMLSRNGSLPSLEAYGERIFAKTASLFALCAETGPILAGQDQTAIDDAWQFGKLLGEAFQITDDVLDIMGTADSLGKPVGTDLKQGLATLPVILYGHAHPDDQRLNAVLAHRSEDNAVLQTLIDDLQASDAADQAMMQADSRVAEALPLLNRYPETEYKRAIKEIARFSVQRRY